jgi:hypothetical protein
VPIPCLPPLTLPLGGLGGHAYGVWEESIMLVIVLQGFSAMKTHDFEDSEDEMKDRELRRIPCCVIDARVQPWFSRGRE